MAKYKVGDSVRIRKYATRIGVAQSHVGKVGIIEESAWCGDQSSYRLRMSGTKRCPPYLWIVYDRHISPASIKGEQLLLFGDL